ncbi:hypothetical protein F5Y18DRAFT_151537 [Xylariaceae sp. FL1019]|nr:hypothetical protein F5Y18DRAFT_151537 [Xylariaceae sp. FL1019]
MMQLTSPSDQTHDEIIINPNPTEAHSDSVKAPSVSQNSSRVFHKFIHLPPELRIQIYAHAIFASPVIRTLGLSTSPQVSLSIHTLQHHHALHGLWGTHVESREEMRHFLSIELPTRYVNDCGMNRLDMNAVSTARRPRGTVEMEARMYQRDTVFAMDHQTATDFFLDDDDDGEGDGDGDGDVVGSLSWVKSLMLYGRTFEHILMLDDGGDGVENVVGGLSSFARLPNLERVFVAFMRRYEDVALVEGAFDEIVKEVGVVRDAEGGWTVTGQGEGVNLGCELEAMIIETVSNTVEEVEKMTRAGIEVRWVVVEQENVSMRWFVDLPYVLL